MRSGEHQRKSHRGICKAKGGYASHRVKLNCVFFALPLDIVDAKSLHCTVQELSEYLYGRNFFERLFYTNSSDF